MKERCIEEEKEKDGRGSRWFTEAEKGFSLRQEDLEILARKKVALIPW